MWSQNEKERLLDKLKYSRPCVAYAICMLIFGDSIGRDNRLGTIVNRDPRRIRHTTL
jgi:hypothetical protein